MQIVRQLVAAAGLGLRGCETLPQPLQARLEVSEIFDLRWYMRWRVERRQLAAGRDHRHRAGVLQALRHLAFRRWIELIAQRL